MKDYSFERALTIKIRIATAGIIFALLIAVSACGKQPEMFPPITARSVPSPGPSPWSGVATYAEDTYRIEVKTGSEFAIAMLGTVPDIRFSASYDDRFVSLADNRTAGASRTTEWFLFKAIRSGKTEIYFSYPIEYRKVFSITIN